MKKNAWRMPNSFLSLAEIKAAPARSSKSPEERESVVDSGALMHMLSTRDLRSEELDGDPETPQW